MVKVDEYCNKLVFSIFMRAYQLFKKFNCIMSLPIYKNSFYLILNSFFNSGIGFLFWILIARIYSPQDMGIASVLTSSVSIIILLSRLGFDFSLISFIPSNRSNKNSIFSTSIFITTATALVLGSILLLNTDKISNELRILSSWQNAIIFLLCIAINSYVTLAGIAFTALRKSELYFFQSLIVSTRIIIVGISALLGSVSLFVGPIGILILTYFSFIIASFVSAHSLSKSDITLTRKIDYLFLKESLHFSIGNYISSVFMVMPIYLMPIIVLHRLDSEATAYYYLTFTISTLLFIIPNSISTSLMVEGCYGEKLKEVVIKSIYSTMFILFIVFLLIVMFGKGILGFINPNYIEGYPLLLLMGFSSFFVALVQIYLSYCRILKRILPIVMLSGFNSITIIVISYLLLDYYGIIGVGIAWIISYVVSSLIIALLLTNSRVIPRCL